MQQGQRQTLPAQLPVEKKWTPGGTAGNLVSALSRHLHHADRDHRVQGPRASACLTTWWRKSGRVRKLPRPSFSMKWLLKEPLLVYHSLEAAAWSAARASLHPLQLALMWALVCAFLCSSLISNRPIPSGMLVFVVFPSLPALASIRWPHPATQPSEVGWPDPA